jgi:hypothetical protein
MPINRKVKALMPQLLIQALSTTMPFTDTGRGEFHLPEISPDERIQVPGEKLRKHHTKRRRNKLHDKRR